MRFSTPLRYPGGKGKLSNYVKAVYDVNDIRGGHYVEPYTGGGAVALDMLFSGTTDHIHINDIDPAIHSFWFSVLNNPKDFIELIRETEITIDEWYNQREILTKNIEEDDVSILKLGFSAFFLNRTNRSGILKAGVIGGKSQSGKWKLDVRFNKEDLIRRIQRISLFTNQISLYKLDAVELIAKLNEEVPHQSLIYLDPPYYVKGQGLYRNYYNHGDHVLIKDELVNSGFYNWIVSYDNAPEIRDIYREFPKKEYSLQYTAQKKSVGSEIMIYSEDIRLPDFQLGKHIA
ncbi:DNA adenine methylase [Vibrio sp. H11]|uniref:DNA adenine methylase n=1 Tax=Vibrio sp. H11 TaxID=2565928 RepID=UPI0010A64A19|nr:DNA adenine methylase [Vibrio sp. H11]